MNTTETAELNRWREAGKGIGRKLGVIEERERILQLVYSLAPKLLTDGATPRDIEAFAYAIRTFRYQLLDAIKEETK